MSPVSLTIVTEDWVTTVIIEELDSTFLTEWWTSIATLGGELVMFSSIQMPIYARNLTEAKTKIRKLHSSYLKLVDQPLDPHGIRCLNQPKVEIRSHIARAHISAHTLEKLNVHLDQPLILQTYFQAEFCRSIGVSSPALLLAGLFNLQPKTVNQRIFEAKKYLLRKQN